MDAERVGIFSDSLTRCFASPGFLNRFYELFIASSPEVAAKFENTDFGRQQRALRSSLYVMVMAVEGGDAALAYLDHVAERHGPHDLDIPALHYELWLDCLVKAAREHDESFDDELEAVWRDVLRFGIDYMIRRSGKNDA